MHWKEEVRKHRLNLKKILEALGILEEEEKRNKWLLTKHTCWDLLLFFIKQSWYYVLITTEPYIYICGQRFYP